MKNSILIIILFSSVFSSCKKEEVVDTLSQQEKNDLIFLRQEEKLARDVYVYSYNKYGDNVFQNISNSEQTHINSVMTLLEKYNIEDPLNEDNYGEFENADLQLLYDQLTAKSDSSLVKALEVGATIEDLDIHDIETFFANTNNADLLNTYEMLTCGSRNHLRSFYAKLDSYTPSFISQEEFDTIINSANEQCGN